MSERKKRQPDEAVERELEGVPDQVRDGGPRDEDEAAGKAGEGSGMAGDEGARLHEGEETPGGTDPLDSLRADLEAARQDALYARAEAQNVRRRAEKDLADARSYAATGFARDILSVADNLERAIHSVPETLRDDDRARRFIEGIEATRRELDKVFGQHGITRIAAKGLPLDPNHHQAMLEVPTDEAEPGTVVQEMQAGYLLRDRLLRPAMVGVAKKPD
jgi:molecular chaperone GrpE